MQDISQGCQTVMIILHLFIVLARPQRDGCAPVPIARDVPVARVREPVAKAVVTDILWNPNADVLVSRVRRSWETAAHHRVPLLFATSSSTIGVTRTNHAGMAR